MTPSWSLRNLFTALMMTTITAVNLTEVFKRPVVTRIWESGQYTLADSTRSNGDRVDIDTVASSIAGLNPSYVSSMIRLSYGTNLTELMISDFNKVRSAVLLVCPEAKFDVELSLDPNPPDGQSTYPNAAAIVSTMKAIDSKLDLDGWWFDYYSTAQSQAPDWVTAVTEYAHVNGQTVGGNVFGNIVPPSSDAVSFVDRPDTSTFGFGIDLDEVAALKQNCSSTVLLGHLNCNPQNGNTTESCVYMNNWNSTRRSSYLDYWALQQSLGGFTFMLPVFFPLCPGAFSFDPLSDVLSSNKSGGNVTLYDYIQSLALGAVGSTGVSSTASYTATTQSVSTVSAKTTHQSSSGPSIVPAQSYIIAQIALFFSLLYLML